MKHKSNHKPKHRFLQLAVILASIVIAVLILKSDFVENTVSNLGDFGFIGIFIAGIFYAYSFTLAPALATLILFAESFNPLVISLLGALGATLGNYLLFHLIRDELPGEAEKLMEELEKEESIILKKLKYHWILPLAVAIIFVSPLPDELGVSLLGTAKFNPIKFILMVFFLHFVGLLAITSIIYFL